MPRKKAKANRRRAPSMFRRKKSKIRKPLALKPHNFVERVEDVITLSSSTLNSDGHLTTAYAKAFKLDDIAQVASYKDLFDDYVLNKVVMELRYDTYYTGTTTADVPINPIYPQLLIKTDHNDASTGGVTWEVLKESEKSRLVQMRPSGKPISHVFKPACQIELYKTALGSAYGPKWNQQIRTIDSGVPHYGIKMQVKTNPPLSGALNLGKICIMYKYYFTMRNAE